MMGWLQRFMMGRYGSDQLSLVLLISGLVLSLVSRFANFWPIYILSLALLGWATFRMLSRNRSARYEENRRFMNIVWGAKNWWRALLARLEENKTYRHFKCSSCSQKIRVPKGRGKIEICCPKCGAKFVKKT